jgi:hypothetical protein
MTAEVDDAFGELLVVSEDCPSLAAAYVFHRMKA